MHFARGQIKLRTTGEQFLHQVGGSSPTFPEVSSFEGVALHPVDPRAHSSLVVPRKSQVLSTEHRNIPSVVVSKDANTSEPRCTSPNFFKQVRSLVSAGMNSTSPKFSAL